MQNKVMLRDGNWYDATFVSSREAIDYEGERYHMKLERSVTVVDRGNDLTYTAGFELFGCHRDCVKVG